MSQSVIFRLRPEKFKAIARKKGVVESIEVKLAGRQKATALNRLPEGLFGKQDAVIVWLDLMLP